MKTITSPLLPLALAAAVLSGVAVLSGTAGCAPQGVETAHNGVLVIGGIDASGSARFKLLGSAVFAQTKLVRRLNPDTDWLSLARVDRTVHEFYNQPAPSSAERLQEQIIAEVQTPSSHSGTYPAAFWKHAADRAAESKLPVVICFATDGDNDDQSATASTEIEQQAIRLAANPRLLNVTLLGVKSNRWEILKKQFKALGNRLQLRSDNNLDIEALSAVVEAARGSMKPETTQP